MKIYRLLWGARRNLIPLLFSFKASFFTRTSQKKKNEERKESLGKVNDLRLIFCIDKVPFTIEMEQDERTKREYNSKRRRRKCYLRTNIENVIQLYNFFSPPLYGVAQETVNKLMMSLVGGKMLCSCSIYANETCFFLILRHEGHWKSDC